MKINIPNGIGTLILGGCGQSNMITRTQEDLDAGKSGRCGVDRICDSCRDYVFRNISKAYKKEYKKSHSINKASLGGKDGE